MFPTINHIDDLLPFIEQNPQIRVKVEPNGLTVVCYMLQDEDTFAGANYEFERECRGITFAVNGKVAARTLHKFFNVGEREDTQPNMIPWSRVVRIMDKRDGSMVTPVFVNGAPKFKTKKSFDTKEAALADKIASEVPYGLSWIETVMRAGMTPTFEVTSPKFPIVLKYDKDELTLLHVRDNVSGRYLTESELHSLRSPFPLVENLLEQFYGDGLPAKLVSWDKLKEAAETREGIEGWIVQLDDGEMFKVKTKWYCDLHHSVTFTRWRDIARTVCEDKADDLKGAFALTGRSIEPILKVEHDIKTRIDSYRRVVSMLVTQGQLEGLTPKDMALRHKGHELFGLIMRSFRGSEIDWMEWYAKTLLDLDWSLEVVEVN